MKQEMLINVAQPEECRIAIVEDGVLEELYVERTGQDSYVGNIYKGVVVNLEPSIQAAFVDFGVGRNGFLHISDVSRSISSRADSIPTSRSGLPATPRRAAIAGGRDQHDKSTTATRGRYRFRRRAATRGGPPRPQAELSHGRPAALQAADSGYPSPRRRDPRASHQGRHRHQGADAFHLHQHTRPLSGSHAGAWAASASPARSRTKTSAAGSVTSCSS